MPATPHVSFRAFALRAAAVLALGLVPVAAFAQGTEEQQQACAPDAVKLCSDTIPDIPKTTACMKAHYGQLSSRCQSAFNDAVGSPKSKAAKPATRAATRTVEPRAHTARQTPERDRPERQRAERATPAMRPHREAALPPAEEAPARAEALSPTPGYPAFPSPDAPLVRAPLAASSSAQIVNACRAGLIDSFTCSTTIPALLGHKL